jgi:hypothetical protein
MAKIEWPINEVPIDRHKSDAIYKLRGNGRPRVLMVARSLIPRLTDIVEAIERINGVPENIARSLRHRLAAAVVCPARLEIITEAKLADTLADPFASFN